MQALQCLRCMVLTIAGDPAARLAEGIEAERATMLALAHNYRDEASR
jgi:hypothetical protein